ncbi:calcium-binding allergen Ole e 8-like [Prosopis cineraria]|uniref:calcium-binding allergen Ole e 8-like n=1 Tax=Prosopis cineraria TaxID=364024 RepID=UPI00240FD997|nr:calcium-binding allergen Ole e 8-like [Prosopis cineraria]
MSTNSTAPATAVSSPGSNPVSKPSMYLQDPEELQRVFKRFDANGDGKISINELDNVLRTLGSGVPPEELQRVMDDLDVDHDGFIDFTEFSQFCRSDTEDGGASELRDAFNLYDHDKNGLISASELHMVLNRLGLKCTVEECRVMIKSVDSDGDGNVNFEEFKTMMTNKPRNGSSQ